jgi:hypothetical protein
MITVYTQNEVGIGPELFYFLASVVNPDYRSGSMLFVELYPDLKPDF